MPWSCEACTFQNAADSLQCCEVCNTSRADGSSLMAGQNTKPKASGSTKSVQSTLFGGLVGLTQADSKPKSRKRKAPPSEQQQQQVPLSKVFQPVSGSNASEPVSFKILKADAEKAMKDIFKIERLRKLQPAAIKGALKGKSQIIVMATGSGKSLCYQLPAVVMRGLTIVVSPLIALMNDQVQALVNKGVQAAVISSSNGEAANLDVLERILGRSLRQRKKKTNSLPQKPLKLLYCTPEQIQTNRFQTILKELHGAKKLSLLAVDEAHCLSSWGHDFRPAFLKLDWFRESFPDVPCMACTATATPKVIEDIKETLHLQDAPCHISSFNRENIFYKVRYREELEAKGKSVIDDMVQFIQKRHSQCKESSLLCSGIIYVHKREETQDLARIITERTGIAAAGYHGGLKAAERKQVQQDWMAGKLLIAVATVAFGMGIDLAHVRYVIHWTLPKTLEGFYQESGRAGRDGLPSVSVLYFSQDDVRRFSYLIQQQTKGKKGETDKNVARAMDALGKVADYALTPCCRRVYVLKHFGEVTDAKTVCEKGCDFCFSPEKVRKAIGVARTAQSYQTGLSSRVYVGSEDDLLSPESVKFSVGGLNINHASEDVGSGDLDHCIESKSFRSSKTTEAILNKFERIESKQGQPTGFVRYRSKLKDDSSVVPVPIIPKHMIPASISRQPVTTAVKLHTNREKTSKELAEEADLLMKDLERKKRERDAKFKAH